MQYSVRTVVGTVVGIHTPTMSTALCVLLPTTPTEVLLVPGFLQSTVGAHQASAGRECPMSTISVMSRDDRSGPFLFSKEFIWNVVLEEISSVQPVFSYQKTNVNFRSGADSQSISAKNTFTSIKVVQQIPFTKPNQSSLFTKLSN